MGPGVPIRHRPARTRSDPDGGLNGLATPDAIADDRTLPAHRGALRGGGAARRPQSSGRDSPARRDHRRRGERVDDALVEIWQANSAGRYAHPEDDREDVPLEDGFTGFGRCATDAEGRFEFLTVKPGPVPGPDDRLQAPHIDVSVFARGLLNRLVTRIYFPDEAEANAGDPVLALIEDEVERQTLIAAPGGRGAALRHPPAGRGRDRFLRHLARSWPVTPSAGSSSPRPSPRRPPGRPGCGRCWRWRAPSPRPRPRPG